MTLVRPLEDPGTAALGRHVQGLLAHQAGRYLEAKHVHEAAVALARGTTAGTLLVDYLEAVADAETALGNYAAAEGLLREALALSRQGHSDAQTAFILNDLGCVLFYAGRVQEALAALHEGVQRAESQGFIQVLMILRASVGEVLHGLGDDQGARQHLQTGLQFARETGLRVYEAAIWMDLGRLASDCGDPNEALSALQKGLGIAWDIRAMPETLRALTYFAERCLLGERHDKALSLLELVLHHPTTLAVDRATATRLRAALPDEATASPALTLKATVEELLGLS